MFNIQKYAPSFGVIEKTWQAIATPYFMDSMPVPNKRFWILQSATVLAFDSAVAMVIMIMPVTAQRTDVPLLYNPAAPSLGDFGVVISRNDPLPIGVSGLVGITSENGPYIMRPGSFLRVLHPDVTIANSNAVLKMSVAELEVCEG